MFQYVLLTCLAEQRGAISARCVGGTAVQLSSHCSVRNNAVSRIVNQGTQGNPKFKLWSSEKAAILLLGRIRLTDPMSKRLLLSSEEPTYVWPTVKPRSQMQLVEFNTEVRITDIPRSYSGSHYRKQSFVLFTGYNSEDWNGWPWRTHRGDEKCTHNFNLKTRTRVITWKTKEENC